LATFPAPYDYDSPTIEKFIMNGCRKGELSIRINHETGTLTFETDVFDAKKGTISEGPKVQSLPSEQMRLHLTRLATHLHTAVALIDPSRREKAAEAKSAAFALAIVKLEEERAATSARRQLIEKKKELRENEMLKRVCIFMEVHSLIYYFISV